MTRTQFFVLCTRIELQQSRKTIKLSQTNKLPSLHILIEKISVLSIKLTEFNM